MMTCQLSSLKLKTWKKLRFIENIKVYILRAKHTILFFSKKSLIIIVQTDRVKQINWFSKFNLK